MKSVDDESIYEEAVDLECLLPRLMRGLFTLQPGHPVGDLPLAQLRVCTILQTGPRSMSALGDELGISVSAITQIADRLEKAGLVGRSYGAEDRRTRLLQLTESGASLMESRREIRVRRVVEALRQLSPHTRRTVLDSVRTLLDVCRSAGELAAEDPVGVRLER